MEYLNTKIIIGSSIIALAKAVFCYLFNTISY